MTGAGSIPVSHSACPPRPSPSAEASAKSSQALVNLRRGDRTGADHKPVARRSVHAEPRYLLHHHSADLCALDHINQIDRPPPVRWAATCNPAAEGITDNHSAKSRARDSQIRA